MRSPYRECTHTLLSNLHAKPLSGGLEHNLCAHTFSVGVACNPHFGGVVCNLCAIPHFRVGCVQHPLQGVTRNPCATAFLRELHRTPCNPYSRGGCKYPCATSTSPTLCHSRIFTIRVSPAFIFSLCMYGTRAIILLISSALYQKIHAMSYCTGLKLLVLRECTLA